MGSQNAAPLLRMRGISKRFGSTVALDNVDFDVHRGEVHALIGENGAGKSTLMKILSGALTADRGEMWLGETQYRPAGPTQARRSGVAMIYQELSLAPHLSVEANVMLGLEESSFGFLRRKRMRRRVEGALAVLHHPDIHPGTAVGRLSPGPRQLVEVARALVSEARIIVMDEPTSSLSREDMGHLFRVIRRLRDRGVGIVYISHFLEEVAEVADRFAVLRDGRSVGGGMVAETETGTIIEMMVGQKLDDMFPRVPHELGEAVLQCTSLRGRRRPDDVSFRLHRGEILGIAGLVGAGRTETLRGIFGLEPLTYGDVTIVEIGPTRLHTAPGRRMSQGLGMLSEDRKGEGLALNMSLADNLTLSNFGPISRWGWINPGRQRAQVERWAGELSILHRDAGQPVETLSGGNQQKAALARLLHQNADVLLVDEPTRGIDVGSKVQIYNLMGRLAAQGKAILFVSSYIPELLGICDRLAVMTRGRLSPVRPVAEWSETSILEWATGEANRTHRARAI